MHLAINNRSDPQRFTFDQIFSKDADQIQLFEGEKSMLVLLVGGR